MNKLTREKKEQKNEAIINAALKIFSKKGYHNTSIEEVAVEAGIGKGTIYRYFDCKENLFFTIIEKKVDEIKEIIMESISSPDFIINNLKKATKAYLEYFEKNQNFYQILIHEKSEFTKKAFIKHRIRQVALFKPLIQEGIDKGEIKPLNAESMTYSLFGLIDVLIWKWLCCNAKSSSCNTESYSLLDELPIIVEIISSGIFINK